MMVKNITPLIAFSLVLFSCSLSERQQQQELDDLHEFNNEILPLIDDSCDTCSQCRSIAFGSKACGGPQTILIYSIKNTDSVLLNSKVTAYNRMEDDFNHKWDVISDCSTPAMPCSFTCDSGSCIGVFHSSTY
jgi:hypothetical protein